MAHTMIVSGGGLDSAALVYAIGLGMVKPYTNDQLYDVLHVDYGQLSAQPEREAVRKINGYAKAFFDMKTRFHQLHVGAHTPKRYNADSELFGGTGSAFIRGRNLWLLMQAAGEAIATYGDGEQITLMLGFCLEGMMFPDADVEFVAQADAMFERAFGYIEQGQVKTPLVRVVAPLMEHGWQKLPLFQELYRQLPRKCGKVVARLALFTKPFTCWTPVEGKPCGTCYHCEKLFKLQDQVVGASR